MRLEELLFVKVFVHAPRDMLNFPGTGSNSFIFLLSKTNLRTELKPISFIYAKTSTVRMKDDNVSDKLEVITKELKERLDIDLTKVLSNEIEIIKEKINTILSASRLVLSFFKPVFFLSLLALGTSIIFASFTQSYGLVIFLVCILLYYLLSAGVIQGLKNILKNILSNIKDLIVISLDLSKKTLIELSDKKITISVPDTIKIVTYQIILPTASEVIKAKYKLFSRIICTVLENMTIRIIDLMTTKLEKELSKTDLNIDTGMNKSTLESKVNKIEQAKGDIGTISQKSVSKVLWVLNALLTLSLFISLIPVSIFLFALFK